MGLYLEEAFHLSGEAWYEKKNELLAKHQPRQRAFVLMCPLAPTLVPRFTVGDAFASYDEIPD